LLYARNLSLKDFRQRGSQVGATEIYLEELEMKPISSSAKTPVTNEIPNPESELFSIYRNKGKIVLVDLEPSAYCTPHVILFPPQPIPEMVSQPNSVHFY